MNVLHKSKPLSPFFWVMVCLTVIGVVLAVYRFVYGLGYPVTNLNDYYGWGLWITIDLYLIPVAGAAFTLSFISYFLKREDFHSIIRPAVLAGFLGYMLVALLLLVDLGKWHQFYSILIPGRINIHSFLEEIALCVTLYTIILVLEIAPVYLEKWGYKSIVKWIEGSIVVIAGIGVALSSLHQSSLGSLFLLTETRVHPLWWSPILPLLSFTQAFYTGISTAVVAVTLVWKGQGMPADRKLLRRMGQLIAALIGLYTVLRVASWIMGGSIGLLFKFDFFGVLVWLEIILGLVVPLGILLSKFGSHSKGPMWAGVFALIGTFINRLVITWLGLSDLNAPMSYVPSFIEIMITIGFLAAGLVVYILTARYFDMFHSPEHAHG